MEFQGLLFTLSPILDGTGVFILSLIYCCHIRSNIQIHQVEAIAK